MRQNVLNLKNDIKALVTEQRNLKQQRKTVHFTGERTMTPYEAWRKHQSNRDDLRHMYIAYGILRGKTLDQIEPNRTSEPYQRYIDTLLQKYAEVEQAV